MNPDIFAEWFRLQERRVVQTQSTYWVEMGPYAYQAFPYHWTIEPNPEELNQLFKRYHALGLRYSLPPISNSGQASYHVVFTDRHYPLEKLKKKARYDVRKGLGLICIEPVPLHRLAAVGWDMRAETLARQGRVKAESAVIWRRICESAAALPGFESWMAYHGDEPAASLIAFTCGECCSILFQQSLTAYLPKRVNHALLYVFTNAVLSQPGNMWIFYGLKSLDAPPGVDQFKFRMGYLAKPVRQQVDFNPKVKFLINPTSYKMVTWLHHSFRHDARLAKVYGMLRSYLQSRINAAQ